MSTLRIEVDIEKLVHQTWKQMPLTRRARLFLRYGPRARRQIEALAVHKMKGES